MVIGLGKSCRVGREARVAISRLALIRRHVVFSGVETKKGVASDE